jgi:hypothetical protein
MRNYNGRKNMYKSITPTSGEWYFVGKRTETDVSNDPLALIFPVAVWAETHDGCVVGLIGDTPAKTSDGLARLVGTPKMEGAYIKMNDDNEMYFKRAFAGVDVKFLHFLK